MTAPTMTRAAAWAAATDAANRRAWAAGRVVWDEGDKGAACTEFRRLWPEARDREPQGGPTWSMRPSHRCKGLVIRLENDGRDGFKGRLARLMDAMNARWSRAAGGYVLPETKARVFDALAKGGFDAELRVFARSPARFISPTLPGVHLTYNEAKGAVKSC